MHFCLLSCRLAAAVIIPAAETVQENEDNDDPPDPFAVIVAYTAVVHVYAPF